MTGAFLTGLIIIVVGILTEYVDNLIQIHAIKKKQGNTSLVGASAKTANLMYFLYFIFSLAMLVGSVFAIDNNHTFGFIVVALILPISRIIANLISNKYMEKQVKVIQKEQAKYDAMGVNSAEIWHDMERRGEK